MTKQGYLIELLCKSYSRFSKCSLCIVINLVYLEYNLAYSAKIHTVIQSLFQRGSYIGEKINFCMIKEPFLLIEMINGPSNVTQFTTVLRLWTTLISGPGGSVL